MSKSSSIKLEVEVTDPPTYAALVTALDYDGIAALLNVVDRPVEGGINSVLSYLLTNKNRSNTGTDLTATAMLGRAIEVTESLVGENIFGSTTPLTLDMIHSAKAFLFLLQSTHATNLDFTNAKVTNLLNDLKAAEVWKTADVNTIIALSQDMQSRGQEIGAGANINGPQVKFALTGEY